MVRGAAAQAPAHDPNLAEELTGHDDLILIGEIEVTTRNVYGPEIEQRSFYGLFNKLHVTSRESFVRQFLWFGPGDQVEADELAEVGRRLRATNLFGEVRVVRKFNQATERHDLTIVTRDRFSLSLGGSGLFVGGVSGFNGTLGERNLFGTGNSLTGSYSRNSEGEERASLAFQDRFIGDSWHQLDLSAGTTEEGDVFSVAVSRPFRSLRDPFTWEVSALTQETAVDFFEGGDTVAEVPRDLTGASLFVARGVGPRFRRWTLGVDLRYDDTSFGVASGPDAARIDIPGDLRQLRLGPFVRYEATQSFEQVRGIDTTDFLQDIQLGWHTDLFLGAQWRREEHVGEDLEPLVIGGFRGAIDPFPDTYVTLSSTGSVRWNDGQAVGWTALAALHAFQQSLPGQTLAASLTYDQVFEGENLPVELNLGEDNGLRGYPAREFVGDRRVRLNLEDRIRTGIEFGSIHVDLVTFFDTAWIDDGSFGAPLSSVGAGLRFGSSELFGSGVLRLDFAIPLDERDGEDFSPSVSLALGQVFSFFGNSSALPGR